jgi:hypothetical protein
MVRALVWAALLAPGGVSGALAAPADDLLSALRQSRTQSARGTAEITVNFPPRAQPTRSAAQLPAVPLRPALLLRNFSVTRADGDVVAGRPTARFDLLPKAGQAARWSLWVDLAWNVPLAYEERDAQGGLSRRAALRTVEASPRRVARPAPAAAPAGLRAAVLAALPGLRLPTGFVPVEARPRAQGGVEITLSDGVNVLALVTAPRAVAPAPGVASRRVGARAVWLVGNLPQSALAAALAGVRGVAEAELGTFLPPAASNP